MTGQPHGGRPAPDLGEDDILMITLRETLKPLCRNGQVEVRSWVCRRCGYPNPPNQSHCRGYLDSPRERLEDAVPPWYTSENARGALEESGDTRTIPLSNAVQYGRGTDRLMERWKAVRADSARFFPLCGIEEGYFVVPCTGTHTQDYGGELVPLPDSISGIGPRESIILATFCGDDTDRSQMETQVDADILRFVQDQLGTGGSICSDRLRHLYAEWCEKLRDQTLERNNSTPLEYQLREWVNRYWNRPEMGAWVCRFCAKMLPTWKDTVEAIREVDPEHVVVRNWDSMGWSSRYSGTTVKCKLGEVPPGLTHRAVWNACERDQCWACQRYHSPDTPGCPYGIAYVCYACNPSGDLRAAITDS